MVFSREDEIELTHYIKKATAMHYGLSTSCLRKLAYEFAKANNKNCSTSWEAKEQAGKNMATILFETQSDPLPP